MSGDRGKVVLRPVRETCAGQDADNLRLRRAGRHGQGRGRHQGVLQKQAAAAERRRAALENRA